MPMICPKCNGIFDQQIQCPSCAVRLHFSSTAGSSKGVAGKKNAWQHSPMGRILVGLLLAQGLALGLRFFWDGSLSFSEGPESSNTWTALFEIIILQGLQAVCLLIAGGLAGAGQSKGLFIGGFIGLGNSFIFLAIRIFQNHPPVGVLLYGVPILETFCGALGGFIGSIIWRPLPKLALANPIAKATAKSKVRRSSGTMLFQGPISWPKVFIGTAVVVVGVISPTVVLDFVMTASRGQMQVSTHLQAKLITWEISGLAMLIGAAIAGFNTFNGGKQGLCVGIGSAIALVGFYLVQSEIFLEEIIGLVACVVLLCMAGGWFGSRLFPPVASSPRRFASS